MAHERAFGRKPEQPGRCTGGDDHAVRGVFGVGRPDDEGLRAELDRRHVVLDHLGAELLGLRAHLVHQVRAHDAVAIARIVLDERGQHQLPAGFQAFDEQRLKVRARGVQGGGQARGARADDDDVAGSHGNVVVYDVVIENLSIDHHVITS